MSNPKHVAPLIPRGLSALTDINLLLDNYAARVAARTPVRPALSVLAELPPSPAVKGKAKVPSPSLQGALVPSPATAAEQDPDVAAGHGEAKHSSGGLQFREEIASFVLSKPFTVSIFGAGFEGGQPIGGVEFAPDAIRQAGLVEALYRLGWEVVDKGNCKISDVKPELDQPVAGVNAPMRVTSGCHQTYQAVKEALDRGHLPLTLGGDHSCAIGSISAITEKHPTAGVIWVDAHADLNTPVISPSGNLHGMPVGFLLGLVAEKVPGLEPWFKPTLTPDRIVYIGLRDVDYAEKLLLRKLGIKAFSMHDVDEFGIGKIMKKALKHLAPLRHRPIHISFDVDSIDPQFVPATGTPVMGGLTMREAAYICEAVSETGLLVGVDMVEVNPKIGTEREREQTVQVAVGIIKSALGHQLV